MRLSIIFTFLLAFISLSLIAQPTVNLGNDTTICQGQSLTLDAGNAGATFLWSTGETTQTINVSTTGVYWVDVDDGVGVTRDSLLLTVLDTVVFSVSDTTVCGGELTLSVDGDSSGVYLWWDAAVGGDIVHIGQTFITHLTSDTVYHIEASSILNETRVGLLDNSGATLAGSSFNSGYFSLNDFGINFDVHNPIILDSVSLYTNGTVSFNLILEDGSGQIIVSKMMTLTGSGLHRIGIGQYLDIGIDYKLLASGITGAKLYLHFNINPNIFPMRYDDITLTGGATIANYYNYFYDWKIRSLACPSTRNTMNVTVSPTPTVNLPVDTLSCEGILTLSAYNSGAVYLWNTGSTDSSLTLTNSDTVSVSVAIGLCVVSDTSIINVLDTVVFSVSDTTVCGGEVSLSVDGDSSAMYLWWDAAVGGDLVHIGQTFITHLTSDTVYHIEASSILNEIRVGLLDNSGATLAGSSFNSGYFSLNDFGINFDVHNPIILDSVSLYTNGTVSFNLILEDGSGQIIVSKMMTLTGSGLHRIGIGQYLDIGTDYKLLASGITGAKLYLHFNINPNIFPMRYDDITLTGGATIANYYNYFYDWKIRSLACPSTRNTMNVTVSPTPTVNLPVDTTFCGGVATFTIFNSGATGYLWSTGATSSNISLTNSGILWGEAAINNCIDRDTVVFTVLDTVAFSVIDTISCGGLLSLSVLGDTSALYVWEDSMNGGNTLHLGNELTEPFWQDTTFYIKSFAIKDTLENIGLSAVGGSYFPTVIPVGIQFDVIQDFIRLYSVKIPTDGALSGTIELRSGTGQNIREWPVNILGNGIWEVILDIDIPEGTDYQLLFKDRTGNAGVYFNNYTGNYPINSEVINITQGAGVGGANLYLVFYDLEIIAFGCPSESKALNVTILPTVNTSSWPQDSIICTDSLILDASYPGATYNWSTGATTGDIIITQSDTVWLSATVGACTTEDTLNVILTNPPNFVSTLSDTTTCPGDITIFAQSDGYTQAWYTSASATTPISFGDSINLNLSDTSTYWVEGINFLLKPDDYAISEYPYPNGGGSFENVATSNYPSRGMNFDVFDPIILNELSVFADTTISATISLVDQYGFSLYSQNISLVTGENILNLDWFIEPSADYRLMLTNLSSGGLYLINNYSFPLIYDEFRIRSGYPVTQSNDYNYFFKWRVSTLGCATDRQPVTINVLEEPDLILPADIAFCNASTGMPLFATGDNNPSYSYQWNTGETTDSIFVTNSGIYEVTVTANGLCSSSSNINVQFLTPPTPYLANDTSICYSSEASLLTAPNEGLLVWSRLPNSGLTVHLGAPYTTYIQDTTTYELEMAARATTRLGDLTHPNPTDLGQYQSFIISNTFDVNEAVILDSVAVYMEQAPATFDIVLKDGSNQEIERRSFTINQAQSKVFVPLDWVILPSNFYRLEFDNASTEFLVNQNTIYPQSSSAAVVDLTGTSFTGVSYNCFYDWHFSYALAGCSAANLDSFTVNVNLPLYLQDSIYACDTAVLNASNGAASYLWSTGETTDSIVAYTEGLYTVIMTDGASCSVVDSITVGNPMPIGLPSNNSLCGIVLSANYNLTNATDFLWSTGDTTVNLTLPSTGIYSVTVTTNDGCVLSDTTFINQIENPPAVNIGTFITICGQDTLDAGFAGFGLSYQWSTGDTTQTIVVDSPGNYAVTVATPNGCAGSDDTFVALDSVPEANYNYTISGTSVALVNISQNADSYYWDFGDGTATTFVQPFHTFPANGCYDVMLVAYNDCGTDTLIQTIAIGVNPIQCDTINNTQSLETESIEMTIFPNPNNGQFTLEFNQAVEDLQMIEVYNAQGQKVWEEHIQAASATGINLNLVDLPAGVYYLSCFTARNRYIQTFVVKRY
jgi:PKD repeat protein